ncbi:MAG TPA: hypothetical protein VFD13_00770 [Candidatus Kapabacteria bacterium]|nr:hypothetical protein [Candidatus Kapabacteria bacterium]
MKEREAVLLQAFHKMDETDQEQLVALATSLWGNPSAKKEVHASNYSSIAPFFGTLPDEDAREMIAIIEEGCERVDPETWERPNFD